MQKKKYPANIHVLLLVVVVVVFFLLKLLIPILYIIKKFAEGRVSLQLTSQAAFYGNSAAEPFSSVQRPLGLQPQEQKQGGVHCFDFFFVLFKVETTFFFLCYTNNLKERHAFEKYN